MPSIISRMDADMSPLLLFARLLAAAYSGPVRHKAQCPGVAAAMLQQWGDAMAAASTLPVYVKTARHIAWFAGTECCARSIGCCDARCMTCSSTTCLCAALFLLAALLNVVVVHARHGHLQDM